MSVKTPGAGLPLQVGLATAIVKAVQASLDAGTVEIVDIRPNPHASTARAEVVQCVVDGRDELAVLLKWAENLHDPEDRRVLRSPTRPGATRTSSARQMPVQLGCSGF